MIHKNWIILGFAFLFLATNVASQSCTDTVELLSDCNMFVQFLKEDGTPEINGNCDVNLYRPDYTLAFEDNQLTHFSNGLYYIETDLNLDVNGMWTFTAYCQGTDENGFNSRDFQVVTIEPNNQLNIIKENTEEIITTTVNILARLDEMAKSVWKYGKRTLTDPDPFPTPLTTEEIEKIVKDISQEQTIGLMGLATAELSIFWTLGIPTAILFGLAVTYLLSKIRKGIFKNEWIKAIILVMACLGCILGTVFLLSFASFNLNILLTIAPLALTIMAAIIHYFKLEIKGIQAWYFLIIGAIISGIITLTIVFYWAVFWLAFFALDGVVLAIIITKATNTSYKGLKVWKNLLYLTPPLLVTVLITTQILDAGVGLVIALTGIALIYLLNKKM